MVGPLGLMRRQWTLPLDRELAIVPNTRRVRSVAIRFFSDPQAIEGLKLDRQRGDGSEFDSLKEFVPGEDSKRIDWKHSARHRKLLVRHHRAERNHQIMVCVDTGRLMCESVMGMPKLDHALNAALLLSYVGLKTGDRVGLYAFGAKVGPFVQPRAGVAAQSILSNTAASLEYSGDETNYTLGLTNLAQRLNRRTLVIVMTGLRRHRDRRTDDRELRATGPAASFAVRGVAGSGGGRDRRSAGRRRSSTCIARPWRSASSTIARWSCAASRTGGF